MPVVAQVLALAAAAVHVMIFVLESVLWRRPAVHGRFGVRTEADARTIAPMAFNQGFYNLFLATGVVVGVVLMAGGSTDDAGAALVLSACASMVLASVVLAATPPRLRPAVYVQGVLPAVAILLTVVL